MKRLFTDHPASVGESYGQHLGVATSFGTTMIVAGLACLVHGILPFLFKKTGSNAIQRLHDRMITNRSRLPASERPAPQPFEAGKERAPQA